MKILKYFILKSKFYKKQEALESPKDLESF